MCQDTKFLCLENTTIKEQPGYPSRFQVARRDDVRLVAPFISTSPGWKFHDIATALRQWYGCIGDTDDLVDLPRRWDGPHGADPIQTDSFNRDDGPCQEKDAGDPAKRENPINPVSTLYQTVKYGIRISSTMPKKDNAEVINLVSSDDELPLQQPPLNRRRVTLEASFEPSSVNPAPIGPSLMKPVLQLRELSHSAPLEETPQSLLPMFPHDLFIDSLIEGDHIIKDTDSIDACSNAAIASSSSSAYASDDDSGAGSASNSAPPIHQAANCSTEDLLPLRALSPRRQQPLRRVSKEEARRGDHPETQTGNCQNTLTSRRDRLRCSHSTPTRTTNLIIVRNPVRTR
ncbi:hypothetical protein QAD02_003186 [Eretmocerus hayati]|uniref:Uncharacterized protein n=1 Tax=Eretmocerus hayati TaxID=131215 RepID=A0ACC2NLE8_9HYME|nr:hypothetical protein QAD02_003186 [Eretmocerus hayati]